MTKDTEAAPSDEELRKLLKPDLSEEDVIQLIHSLETNFAPGKLIKIVKQLDSYDDVNYLVNIDGTRFLCKIHNGVESKDFIGKWQAQGRDYNESSSVIHLQNNIMSHLNKMGIPTNDPQLNAKSNMPVHLQALSVVSKEHSPCDLVVRLLTWIEGSTMCSLNVLPLECLADAGRFLGRVDRALDELVDPAADRFHAWDGKNTVEIRPFVEHITDERRRNMVTSVLDAFQREILDSGDAQKLRTGIIQGDFNDANVLMDSDFHVCGIIDFGDSVSSWRVLDCSVAMAYAMLSVYAKPGRTFAAAAAFLRGFVSAYPLEAVELKHLHLLVASRLACSCTIGNYSFQQNPENTYLLLHSQPAWKALELLWGYDHKRRSLVANSTKELFAKACSFVGNENADGVIDCTDLSFPDPQFKDVLSTLRNESASDVDGPAAKRIKVDIDKPTITFVTGSAKKLEEVQRILSAGGDLPFTITNYKVDLPELQGDVIEIAKEKCTVAAEKVGGPVITEDTSLCFTALQDLPGPYITWFLEKCGHEGLNKMIEAYNDKSGYAQTVVAFCAGPGQEVTVFDGRTMGKIVSARGKLDFGWDPIFEPDEGGGKTYAEMGKEEKDAISHRSRAFAKLRDFFIDEQASITTPLQ